MTTDPPPPYGQVPRTDPADVPWCRPDVPVNPPAAGWGTNEFRPGAGWPAPDLPWLGGRAPEAPVKAAHNAVERSEPIPESPSGTPRPERTADSRPQIAQEATP